MTDRPLALLHRPRAVLLTGVTGFVGQALLERFLREETEIHVLIRPRGEESGSDRLLELLDKSAFDRWRAEVGVAGIARARARLHVVEGDLAAPLPDLPGHLDLVVHSASSVTFDDPLDASLDTNVGGPRHLYEALLRSGSTPHVVHVSTAYVGTDRGDLALERSVEHDVDWRAEIAAAHALRRDLEAVGDAREADRVLTEQGRRRARELGWTDSYTMSKALGERVAEELWAGCGHRLTVLRPTIIESALERPHPGWIDGFKVADPLIAAYAKDKLVAFPGHPDAVLDIVPVDVVVDAAMAAAYVPMPDTGVRYFQVGTGVTNPITLDRFRAHIEEYISAHPWRDGQGRDIHPRPWRFLAPDDLEIWTERRSAALRQTASVLRWFPGSIARPTRRRVEAARRGLTLFRTYVAIYQPYSCSRTVYDDTRTRELLVAAREAGLAGALDVSRIDWARYLQEGHMPSLTRIATRSRSRRPVPDSAPGSRRQARRHDTVTARAGA